MGRYFKTDNETGITREYSDEDDLKAGCGCLVVIVVILAGIIQWISSGFSDASILIKIWEFIELIFGGLWDIIEGLGNLGDGIPSSKMMVTLFNWIAS